MKTLDIMLSHGRPNSQEPQIIHTPELREINFGVREALLRGTTIAQAKKIISKRMGVSEETIMDTAEAPRELADRQLRLLRSIQKDIHAKVKQSSSEPGVDKSSYKVLCVTHGGFIKGLLREHCKITPPSKIDNCSVSIVSMIWDACEAVDDFTLSVDERNVNNTFDDIFT